MSTIEHAFSAFSLIIPNNLQGVCQPSTCLCWNGTAARHRPILRINELAPEWAGIEIAPIVAMTRIEILLETWRTFRSNLRYARQEWRERPHYVYVDHVIQAIQKVQE